MRSAIVLAGGVLSTREREATPRADIVVAADSGFDRALGLGLEVDIIVGDLDSISARGLAEAERRGVPIERSPMEKDQTDLELAIDAAIERGAQRLLVLGSGGGRRDHELANVLLISSARFAAVEIEAWQGDQTLTPLHGDRRFEWRPGDAVSLLPIGGPATGIVTTGLRYPLSRETLAAGTPRGVSNVVLDPVVRISVDRGVLLVVHTAAGRLPA